MREDDYSIFWGMILLLFCVDCVTNLWNECFIITDGLNEMALQKSIILSESNEKRMPNMGRAVSGLVIQLCLLWVIMTYFGLYNAGLITLWINMFKSVYMIWICEIEDCRP